MNQTLMLVLTIITLTILFSYHEQWLLNSKYIYDEKCTSRMSKVIRFLFKFFFWPEQRGSGNIGNLMYSRNKRIFNGRWYLVLTATYTGGLIFTILFFVFPPTNASIDFYDNNFIYKTIILTVFSLVLRYFLYKFNGVDRLIFERKNNIKVEGEYPWQDCYNKKQEKNITIV